MLPKQAEKLAWILVYSGMLLGVLGWFVGGQGSDVGLVMMVFGALDACVGVGLIWWRSRQDDKEQR